MYKCGFQLNWDPLLEVLNVCHQICCINQWNKAPKLFTFKTLLLQQSSLFFKNSTTVEFVKNRIRQVNAPLCVKAIDWNIHGLRKWTESWESNQSLREYLRILFFCCDYVLQWLWRWLLRFLARKFCRWMPQWTADALARFVLKWAMHTSIPC